WTLRLTDDMRQAERVRGRRHDKALAAKRKGLDDREEARTFTGYEICIPRSELPSLEEGEYYWHQLEGLKVIDQAGQLLGGFDHL
ncbi:ribosome maturation factor RimM, partial [Escherichia coli]|uniref:ribosome maturation factor RimM n=1 Tax=Escherichia coli TaxID=562 RepID=UPI00390C7F32